jgi:hypothetical protein
MALSPKRTQIRVAGRTAEFSTLRPTVSRSSLLAKMLRSPVFCGRISRDRHQKRGTRKTPSQTASLRSTFGCEAPAGWWCRASPEFNRQLHGSAATPDRQQLILR